MGFISDALNRIQPSATIAISNKALAMQAEGQNVLFLAAARHRRMHFRPDDRGEGFRAARSCVGDGKIEARQEMIGNAEEIVAALGVTPADLFRRQAAV